MKKRVCPKHTLFFLTTVPSSPQSTGTPSSTPSAPPPHFHSHPDSNPDVPPLLLPDNPSSGLAPTLAMNAVAIPSVYPLLSHGSPSHPHSKFRCYGHCSPSRGHRPSRPGVWIGYRRCGGRRNDSLRHQNHGGGERYPGRAR